jgi:hypothetical protein
MSSTLPCPICGDNMWDHQAMCHSCIPKQYRPKIPSTLQELAYTAISERYRNDKEFREKIEMAVMEESCGKEEFCDLLEEFESEFIND